MRRRRKQLILGTVVLVAFVAVLAVWVGNPNKGHETIVAASTPPTPSATETPPDDTLSISTSPTPTPSATGTGTDTGAGGVKLPPVSGVQIYGAGVHQVVIHVTSDSVISAVGYAFRNGTKGKKTAVQRDFTYSAEVEGGAPLAIVGAQVSYYGTEVTCSISVDGHNRITKTVHGPYHVVVCIA